MNDPIDAHPLWDIDWEQIVRSLVQGSSLIENLLISSTERSINLDLQNLQGNTTVSKQRYFMRIFFLCLAEALEKSSYQTICTGRFFEI